MNMNKRYSKFKNKIFDAYMTTSIYGLFAALIFLSVYFEVKRKFKKREDEKKL
jgi:hypothetical protein